MTSHSKLSTCSEMELKDERVSYTDITWLIDERKKWRAEFEAGQPLSNHYLDQYRKNRDSDLWRSTRAIEKLCEYVLYLESEVERLEDRLEDIPR